MLLRLLFVVVFGFCGQAMGAKITHLRNDRTVPEKCKTNVVADFLSHELEYITYSRTGGKKRGFDEEYKISREVVRRLWRIFKNASHNNPGSRKWIRSHPEIEDAYKILKNNYQEMDFDFNDEGQVLELLALVDLRSQFDLSRYYITGSVAYSGNRQDRRLGELDIVVGDVKTCQVVMVGEVKVNPKRLSLARSQLSRFRKFLDSERGW